jgi:hypothetical protein
MPARSTTYAADWRSQPSPPSGTSLRLARLAATGLVLLLLFCLIFFLIRLFPSRATVAIACLPIQQYDPLAAGPIHYAWLDAKELEQLVAGTVDEDNDWFKRFGHASALWVQNDLLPRLAGKRADVLICAVWARLRWDSSGPGLVCSDWQPHHGLSAGDSGGGEPVVSLSDLLKEMAKNRAKHKILILDAGRGDVGPDGGMPSFDLEEFVQAELTELTTATLATGRVWVWLTDSSWEQSHVMPDQQRSVFHYFLAEALRGEADGITREGVDGVKDRRIDLAEAEEYVRREVSDWVWKHSHGGRTQTPRLLASGNAEPLADASQVVLRYLPRDAPSEKADRDTPETTADKAQDPALAPPAADTTTQDDGVSAGLSVADGSSGQGEQPTRGSEISEPTSPLPDATPATAESPATPNATGHPIASEPLLDREPAWPAAASATLQEILMKYTRAKKQPLLECAELESELSGWKPVDFAPHLVRRFDEVMVAYHGRAMSLPRQELEAALPETQYDAIEKEIVTIRNEVALRINGHHRNVCGFAKSFRGSRTQTTWDESPRVRELIRTRNQTLFELPYYIRMLTQLPGAVDEHGFHGDAQRLIAALKRLRLALESEILKRTPSGTGSAKWIVSIDPGGIETDLETLIGEVGKHRESLRDRLCLSSPEDLLLQDRLYLFDLLATPLLDPADRMRVMHRVLASPDTTPPVSGVQGDRARQRAERRVRLRALLAEEAALLVGSRDEQNALLWDRSEDGGEPTFRSEMALRLAPAWLSDLTTVSAPVGVPVYWRTEAAPRRFLPPTGSDPGPLPLSSQPKTLVWTLELPEGTVREGLDMSVEYPEDLLQVTGQEGLSVLGRKTWRIGPVANQTQFTLPLQVRPLKQDGSEIRVTIRLLGEGLEGLRATALLQLPEPSLLNVSIAGPEGTFGGDLRAALGTVSERERPVRQVEFDESARAKVAVRPYPSAPTAYEIHAGNPSRTDWHVRATVWVIPEELRLQHGQGFDPWDRSSQGPVSGCVLQARNEWTIPAGQTLPIPFFPQAAEPDSATEPDSEGPASPPVPATEPVEVGGGLLCLLEHSGQQQWLWIDVHPLHPEAYLKPEVLYHPAKQQLTIRILPDLQRLPPGLTRVRWEIPPELRDKIREQRHPTEFDLRADLGEISAGLTVDPAVQPSLPVVISADGYPRAFEYQCPMSGARSDRISAQRWRAKVLLYEVDEKGQFRRDERGELIPIPPDKAFSELEQIGVVFRADTPPPGGDLDFRLRVFVEAVKTPGSGAARGESREFFRDREVSVRMEQPESGPGFVLHSRIEELRAVLNTHVSNQRMIVRGEVRSIPREGGPPTLRSADQLSILHDAMPPRIVGISSTEITAGDLIEVSAEDQEHLSGVVQVRYALELGQTGELLEPKMARRHQSTPASKPIFQVPSDAFPPDQDHDLYLAATDGAGNTSVPVRYRIHVKAVPPEPAQEPEKMPPATKRIEGEVVYGRFSIRDAKILLKGPKEAATSSDLNGRFEFRDLPPGKYELHASGRYQGSLRSTTHPIDLTGPEPSVRKTLTLK